MSGAPTIGLVVTSIGRPAIADLLASAARSTCPPNCVAVANQSGEDLHISTASLPFSVEVLTSSGGASRGRNDAFAALAGTCDVVGFPNDDSEFRDDIFSALQSSFSGVHPPSAVALRLQDPDGMRFRLPPVGVELDRRTVWRAIEPAMFVSSEAFRAVGGFRNDLGTGAGSAWGSGEGTDLLLRIMEAGGRIVSRPDLAVYGHGERRRLDSDMFVIKHREYARGTGYVYRVHDYPLRARLRTLMGPLAKPTRHADDLGLSLRLAGARSLGRLEGLSGRSLARSSFLAQLEPSTRDEL